MEIRVISNAPYWCSYDNIWKISWKINDKNTHRFSSRGKRIGEVISSEQKETERLEALERLDCVRSYLEGTIERKEAVARLSNLRFLSPRRPIAHICTMLEYLIRRR